MEATLFVPTKLTFSENLRLNLLLRAVGSSEKQGGRNLKIDLANHVFEDEIDKIH